MPQQPLRYEAGHVAKLVTASGGWQVDSTLVPPDAAAAASLRELVCSEAGDSFGRLAGGFDAGRARSRRSGFATSVGHVAKLVTASGGGRVDATLVPPDAAAAASLRGWACSEAGNSFGRLAGGCEAGRARCRSSGFATRLACSEAGDSFGRLAGGFNAGPARCRSSGFATRLACSEAGNSFGRLAGGFDAGSARCRSSGFATRAGM